MKVYTIQERLVLREIPKEAIHKIIDFNIKKFLTTNNIQPNEKFYWESNYVFDKFFRKEFKNVSEFQKYLQKSYTQYLKHSEIHCVVDFCVNFLEDCYGEQR